MRAEPQPRMEYTATGFVQPIKRVFETIYQPTVKLETEFLEQSKYFIKHERFEFHIEPVFEKYLYTPIVTYCLAAADRFRIIQAGSLHLYLAYIFVTLVSCCYLPCKERRQLHAFWSRSDGTRRGREPGHGGLVIVQLAMLSGALSVYHRPDSKGKGAPAVPQRGQCPPALCGSGQVIQETAGRSHPRPRGSLRPLPTSYSPPRWPPVYWCRSLSPRIRSILPATSSRWCICWPLGPSFLILAGLDAGSAFGGMGSSREAIVATLAEPAMMLSIFAIALTAGSTNLSTIVHKTALMEGIITAPPPHLMALVAFFVVALAETGRVPVDNPATHLELTMIHEAMLLEYSGRYLALLNGPQGSSCWCFSA